MPSFNQYRNVPTTRRTQQQQPQNGDVFSAAQVNAQNAQRLTQQHAALYSSPAPTSTASRRAAANADVIAAGKAMRHVQRADGTLIPVAAITGDDHLVSDKGHFTSPTTGERFIPDPTSRTGLSSIGTLREEMAAKAAEKQAKIDAATAKEAAKIAVDAEKGTAKAMNDAAKLANAQATNKLLAQGRAYNIDRVTGAPIPKQSDEEFANDKALRMQKLQQEAAAKPYKKRLDELELELSNPDLPKVSDKDIEDANEGMKSAASSLMVARGNEDFSTPISDEELQQALTDPLRQESAAKYVQAKKNADELPKAAAARKALEREAFETKKRILDPLAYTEDLKSKVKSEPSQDLSIRADEIAARVEARKLEHEQKAAEIQKKDEELSAQHSYAKQRYDEALANGADAATIGTLGGALQDLQQQASEWQGNSEDQRLALQAEGAEINRDIEHLNIIGDESNKRQQAAVAQQSEALEKALPGAGKEYTAALEDGKQRAAALKAKYPDGPESSPEAKAAFDAFQQDIQGKVEVITKKAQAKATERGDDLKAARIAIKRDGFGADTAESMAKSGLDPKNPKHKAAYFDANALLNLDRPTKALWQPGDNIPKGFGSTTLSDGALHVSPEFFHDSAKYAKVVDASDASDEEKANAMLELPKLKLAFAESVLPILKKAGTTKAAQWIPGIASFQKWQSEKTREGSEVEQASQYLEEMSARGGWSKGADNVLRSMLAGFSDYAVGKIGSLALSLGNETLSNAAASWSKESSDFMQAAALEGADSTYSSAVLGQVARMAGPMGFDILITRGLGGGLGTFAAMAATQTAGSQYAEAYGQLREEGKSHKDAWKQTAPYALASGLVTAMLTAAGGRTGFEAALGAKKVAGQALTAAEKRFERKALEDAAKGFWWNLRRNVPKQALAEIPEEFPDEIFSQISQALSTDPNADINQVVGDFMVNAPAFLGAIALLGGAGGVMETRKAFPKGGNQPAPTDLDETDAGVTLPEDQAAAAAGIAAWTPKGAIPSSIQDAAKAAYGKETTPEQQTEAARTTAQAILDIASGQDPRAMSPEVRRMLGIKVNSKDGSIEPASKSVMPLVESVVDSKGVHQPVITDAARDWITRELPDAGAQVKLSYAERVDQIKNPKAAKQTSAGVMVGTEAAPEAAPEAKPASVAASDGAAEGVPLNKRAKQLSKALQARGVAPDVANSYAAKFDGTNKTASTDTARQEMFDAFEKAGGKFPGESQSHIEDAAQYIAAGMTPDEAANAVENAKYWNEDARNKDHAANAALITAAPAKDQSGGKLIETANNKADQVIKSLTGKPKQNAAAAKTTLIAQLRRYNGKLKLREATITGHGAAQLLPDGVVEVDTAKLLEIASRMKNEKRAEQYIIATFRHEIIHLAAISTMDAKQVLAMWKKLPPALQQETLRLYNIAREEAGQEGVNMNDFQKGHEYIRALVEADVVQMLSEQAFDTGLKQELLQFLADFLDALRNLAKSIKDPSVRADVEKVRDTVKASYLALEAAIDAEIKAQTGSAPASGSEKGGAQSIQTEPAEGSIPAVAKDTSIINEKESSGESSPFAATPPRTVNVPRNPGDKQIDAPIAAKNGEVVFQPADGGRPYTLRDNSKTPPEWQNAVGKRVMLEGFGTVRNNSFIIQPQSERDGVHAKTPVGDAVYHLKEEDSGRPLGNKSATELFQEGWTFVENSPFAANKPSVPLKATIQVKRGKKTIPFVITFPNAESAEAYQWDDDYVKSVSQSGTVAGQKAKARVDALIARLMESTWMNDAEVRLALSDYHREINEEAQQSVTNRAAAYKPKPFILAPKAKETTSDILPEPEEGDIIGFLKTLQINRVGPPDTSDNWAWYQQLKRDAAASKLKDREAQKAARNGDITDPKAKLAWLHDNLVSLTGGRAIDEAAEELANNDIQEYPISSGDELGQAILAALDARLAAKNTPSITDQEAAMEGVAIADAENFATYASGSTGKAFTAAELSQEIEAEDELKIGNEFFTVIEVDAKNGEITLESSRFGSVTASGDQVINLTAGPNHLRIGKQPIAETEDETLGASPSRARESMTFDPPFNTRFGDILSYEWMSQAVGGMDSYRVSDWNQARTNPATGREIVHHFKVRKPDGIHTVSLETALGQLTKNQRRSLQGIIKAEQQRRAEAASGQMTLLASPSANDSRFDELTASLPDVMTAEDIARFKSEHPEKYAELEKMREEVLKAGGWDTEGWQGFPTDRGPVYKLGLYNDHIRTEDEKNRFGFFFSNSEAQADKYRDPNGRSGGTLRKVVLSGKILDLTAAGPNDADVALNIMSENGVKHGVDADEYSMEQVWRMFFDDGPKFRKAIKKAGFDGVSFNEVNGYRDSITTAVFNPAQIKSADPLAPGPKIPPSQWGDASKDSILFASPSAKNHDEKTDRRAQAKWIDEQAKGMGISADSLVLDQPDAFSRMAIRWRFTHPQNKAGNFVQNASIRAIVSRLYGKPNTTDKDTLDDRAGAARTHLQSAAADASERADAKGYIEGSSPSASGLDQGGSKRARAIIWKRWLKEFAEPRGILLAKMPRWIEKLMHSDADIGQSEHHVFEMGERFLKITKGTGASFGLFPKATPQGTAPWTLDYIASPADYLKKQHDANMMFGDDIVLHAVVHDNHGNTNLILSQPKYDLFEATTGDIQEAMKASGFIVSKSLPSAFYRPADNAAVVDFHLENGGISPGPEKLIMPFDVTLFHPKGALREAIAKDSGVEPGPEDADRYIPISGNVLFASPDASPVNVMSKSRVEDMLKRAWNANMKDYFDDGDPNDPHSWQEWVKMDEARQVALVLDSDYEINQRFLANLPEDIVTEDIVQAYKDGKLTNEQQSSVPPSRVKLPLGELPFESTGAIGEPPLKAALPAATLTAIFNTAKLRATKANTPAVMAARKTFLIQAHVQDVAETIGVSQKDINKALRTWSNYSADAKATAERLNHDVPDVSEWTGIQNSAFISRTAVSPADVDAMVRNVEAPDKSWNTPDAQSLRNYIVRTFLALDTRINYSDLTFLVESAIKPRGLYQSFYRTITMRENSPHTLAHEVGHYLDHKWGLEAGVDTLLSDSSISLPIVAEQISPERAEWVKKFRDWVMDISERADTRSAYTQSRREAFARFVDAFVAWTAKTAGVREIQRDIAYSDRFNQGDFTAFVRLLQEKAFVDAKDGNPNGSAKNPYTPPQSTMGDDNGVASLSAESPAIRDAKRITKRGLDNDPDSLTSSFFKDAQRRAKAGQIIRTFERDWKPFFTYIDDTAPYQKRVDALRKIVNKFGHDQTSPESRALWESYAKLDHTELVPEDTERVKEAKELLPYIDNLTLGASPSANNPNTQTIHEIRQQLQQDDAGRDEYPVPPERLQAQAKSLLHWATNSGREIDRAAIERATNRHNGLAGGEEHDVWLPNAADGRVIKLTKKGVYGIQQDLTRYLDTIAESNSRFGDDIIIEGVVQIDGWPHILISQPFYVGTMASPKEIDGYFKDAGYTKTNDGMYKNAAGDIVYDAFPRNVLKLTNGAIMPMDVQVRLAAEQTLGASPSGYKSPASMLSATAQTMQGMKKPAAPEFASKDLHGAYRRAIKGSSSLMLPMRKVFDAAKHDYPQLSAAEFMSQVKADYYSGLVMLEPSETQGATTAAGAFTLRDSLGLVNTGMSFIPTTEDEMIDAAEMDTTSTPDAILSEWAGSQDVLSASPSAEPSPGGLSEAIVSIFNPVFRLDDARLNNRQTSGRTEGIGAWMSPGGNIAGLNKFSSHNLAAYAILHGEDIPNSVKRLTKELSTLLQSRLGEKFVVNVDIKNGPATYKESGFRTYIEAESKNHFLAEPDDFSADEMPLIVKLNELAIRLDSTFSDDTKYYDEIQRRGWVRLVKENQTLHAQSVGKLKVAQRRNLTDLALYHGWKLEIEELPSFESSRAAGGTLGASPSAEPSPGGLSEAEGLLKKLSAKYDEDIEPRPVSDFDSDQSPLTVEFGGKKWKISIRDRTFLAEDVEDPDNGYNAHLDKELAVYQDDSWGNVPRHISDIWEEAPKEWWEVPTVDPKDRESWDAEQPHYAVETNDGESGWMDDEQVTLSLQEAVKMYVQESSDDKRLVYYTGDTTRGKDRFGEWDDIPKMEIMAQPSFVEKLLRDFPGMTREEASDIAKTRNTDNTDTFLVAQAYARHNYTDYDDRLKNARNLDEDTSRERSKARFELRESIQAVMERWTESSRAAGGTLGASPSAATPESTRHAELEAKFNAGTITAEETAEAQRIVDAAEEDAGFEKMFHGNTRERTGRVASTELGVHFGDEDAANNRLEQTGQDEGVVNPYWVKIENPVVLKYDPAEWMPHQVVEALPKPVRDKLEESYEYQYTDIDYGELKSELQKQGFDGIKYPNAFEGGISYVAFEKSQFHQPTDPITRDEQGNVIPLSARFNAESDSILHASPSAKRAAKRGPIDPTVANQGDTYSNREAFTRARASYVTNELDKADFEQISAEQDQRIEEDEAGVLDDIQHKVADGVELQLEDEIARRKLANRLRTRGVREGDKATVALADSLWGQDIREATETARKLAARVDKAQSPQERLDSAMGRIIAPNMSKLRARISKAWTPNQKRIAVARLKEEIASAQTDLDRERLQRTLAEIQARKDQDEIIAQITEENNRTVDETLNRIGLTQADLSLTPDERHAMQVSIMDAPTVKKFIAAQSDVVRKAIEMVVRGYTDAAIARDTGIPVGKVSGIAENFRNNVAKPAIAQLVTVGKHTFGSIIESGKNLIRWILGASPAPLPGMIAKGVPNAASVNAQVQAILNAAIPTSRQRNRKMLHAAVVNGKKGQKITVFVAFDPTDWKQVYRAARELSTRESSMMDKMYEYWINGILSGPQTHVVNTASNLLSTAWHYGPQWFASATANSFVRDPNSTQWGEFKHVWAGFLKGISPALENFALAWSAEADPIEYKYLDQPVTVMFHNNSFEKAGGGRAPTIGGATGRVVRVPGRFLVAMDAFAKTLIMHGEASAFAYRTAKRKGYAGVAMTNFIAHEIATMGSDSWIDALKVAKELTFQDENEITEAVESATNALKKNKYMGLLFRFLLPFVRTPTNIYRAGMRKAGGSAGVMLWRLGKAGMASRGKNGVPFFDTYSKGKLVQDVSESVMAGIMWFGLMVLAAAEGDEDDEENWITITGSRPYGVANAGERASQYRQEGGSNLIIIRKNPITGAKLDKPIIINYGRLEPLALTVGTLTDAARELKEWRRLPAGDQTANRLAGTIMAHLASQAQDKTFLQGISGVLEIIDKGTSGRLEPGHDMAKFLIAGAIPNLIRQPLRQSTRELVDSKKPHTILGSSILASTLADGESKINELGQPATRRGSMIGNILFPGSTEPSHSIVDAALKNWNTRKPGELWNPDTITKGDWYIYDPAEGSKKGKYPLKESRQITLFEKMVGIDFAKRAAEGLAGAGYRRGANATAEHIAIIKKARETAIKTVRQMHPSAFSPRTTAK